MTEFAALAELSRARDAGISNLSPDQAEELERAIASIQSRYAGVDAPEAAPTPDRLTTLVTTWRSRAGTDN